MPVVIEFDPRLVERAVVLAANDDPVFHMARETAYATADPDARDQVFARVHSQWFERLNLGACVRELICEHAIIELQVVRVVVSVAVQSTDEGAELFVRTEDGMKSLCLRVRAETLVRPEETRNLLRRELLYVADMLDPTFGYVPKLPPSPAGPIEDRLRAARYGVLWATTVVGRLVRRGHLPLAARAEVFDQFVRAFPRQPQAVDAFDNFFLLEQPTLTHDALVRFAGNADPLLCSLCQMPTVQFTADEMCLQCADMISSRAAS